jgi:hypothetical protein
MEASPTVLPLQLHPGLSDVLGLDAAAAVDIGCKHGAIAEQVDLARNPAGEPKDHGKGASRKLHPPVWPSHHQSVMDIILSFLTVQGLEMIAQGDALVELAQIGSGQLLP